MTGIVLVLKDVLACSFYLFLIIILLALMISIIKQLVIECIKDKAVKVYLKMLRDGKNNDKV